MRETIWRTLSGSAWPGALLRIGHGIDGADLALLDDIDPVFAASHYHRVVIGSGDHAFCALVSAVRPPGTAVLVVARPDAVSRDLRATTFGSVAAVRRR